MAGVFNVSVDEVLPETVANATEVEPHPGRSGTELLPGAAPDSGLSVPEARSGC
jgi:hypothetical protein